MNFIYSETKDVLNQICLENSEYLMKLNLTGWTVAFKYLQIKYFGYFGPILYRSKHYIKIEHQTSKIQGTLQPKLQFIYIILW